MSATVARSAAGYSLSPPARLIHAREGDHHAVHHFLRQTVQQPSDDEFAAQIDRPGYRASDRLLIVEDDRIVAHLLRTPRPLAHSQLVLPSIEVSSLVTASDRRGRGYASHLLSHALDQTGALLGSLRTDMPSFYQPHGWIMGPRQCWSTACPRDVLSLLSANGRRSHRLQIRMWRQVEQAALTRLHDQACARGFGICQRSEEDWRWLIGRGACDRVYIAIDGESASELDASDVIVAFAFVQHGRIVEFSSEPGREDAGREILHRVCADAIEAGFLEVRLDAPQTEPLHAMLEEAGGRRYHVEAERGMVNMMRVPSLNLLLETLAPALRRRAQEAQTPRPSELGLACEHLDGRVHKHRVVLAKNSVQIAAGKVGRSYLIGPAAEIQQLVLGRLGIDEALAQGRIEASTHMAVELATTLFPTLPLFRSVLEDLLL